MVADALYKFGHVFVAARDNGDLDVAFEAAELFNGNVGAFANKALRFFGNCCALDRVKHAHLHAPRKIFALGRGFMRDILLSPLLYGGFKALRIWIIHQTQHTAVATL